MNVILTGFMGTGKTAVGKRLAKRLGWTFVDIDKLIETAAGLSVPRIFAERGEPVFRRIERRCIARVVRDRDQVIATGGGAFVDPQSQGRLRASGPVICLTAKPQAIVSRVGSRLSARPMLSGAADPLARVKSLLAQRAAAYAKADLTIDTSDRSFDEIVERIWEQLSPHLCCPSWQYLLDHVPKLARRYGGKYVAVIHDRVVASGGTQLEAYRRAGDRLKAQPEAGIYYIPLPEESLVAL